MSKIKTEQLTVNTVHTVIYFEDVEFMVDKDNTALIVFESTDTVTVFPLCNVVHFTYKSEV